MVQSHGPRQGPWDFKQLGRHGQYEAFGNYHYGVVGRAAGIPEGVLLRGAGWAQIRYKTSTPSWQPAPFLGELQPFMPWPWGRAPFGDDPGDQTWISQGSSDWDSYYSGYLR